MSAVPDKVSLPASAVRGRVDSPFRRFLRDFCESKLAVGGFFVILTIAILALFAPWFAPTDPTLVRIFAAIYVILDFESPLKSRCFPISEFP